MTPTTVEIATEEHAAAIAELAGGAAKQAGLELDWTRLGANWLVAALEDRVVGCVQVLPALPVGRAESLAMADDLTPWERAKVAHALINQACATLRLVGCQAVMTSVPDELEDYVDVLQRFGGRIVARGPLLMKRLV